MNYTGQSVLIFRLNTVGYWAQQSGDFLQVKKGCTLVLYDDNADNVFKRGRSYGVTAYGQNQAVGKTLSGKDVRNTNRFSARDCKDRDTSVIYKSELVLFLHSSQF